MTRRGLVLSTMWGFVALAFLGGVVLGAVLPLWQRVALQNDVDVLNKRLASKEDAAEAAEAQVADLKDRIASLEASTQELTALNAQLSSEIASITAARQTPAPAAATTTQQSSTAGSPVIVAVSVSPTTVNGGDPVELVVKTKGTVTRATIRIDGPTGSKYDYTFSLKKVATEGDVAVWRTVLKAPNGSGTYRCIGSASNGSKRTTAGAIGLTIN